jgi:Transposase DDE domain
MVTIFCDIDDFCQRQWATPLPPLPSRAGKRNGPRGTSLALSEMMTMLVFFHASHYRTFQHFSQGHLLGPGRAEFPHLPSYTRFVELIPRTLVPPCAYVQTRQGQPTGIQFIDSLPIRVCHHRRLSSHRVLAGLAQRGKGSRGWFYGFKLHLVIHEPGELLGSRSRPATRMTASPPPNWSVNCGASCWGIAATSAKHCLSSYGSKACH